MGSEPEHEKHTRLEECAVTDEKTSTDKRVIPVKNTDGRERAIHLKYPI